MALTMPDKRSAKPSGLPERNRRLGMMVDFVLIVFVLVYLGMFLGEIPGLALDRTGVAVLGAIALVVGQDLSLQEAWNAVDVSTLGVLGALMVVSAQLRLGGFYAFLTCRLAAINLPPPQLLAVFVFVTAILSAPEALFVATAILSNVVSNVPAVMLLLPAATHPAAGPVLALASTLAGNLLLVGSITNIIVVEQAKALGVEITPAMHARVGIPVTIVTLALMGIWLALVF